MTNFRTKGKGKNRKVYPIKETQARKIARKAGVDVKHIEKYNPNYYKPKNFDKWSKANNDFGDYAIYRNPEIPDINIHFARVRAHESYGYKYGVWKSGYPTAKFVGGSNNLKEAKDIAEKYRPKKK